MSKPSKPPKPAPKPRNVKIMTAMFDYTAEEGDELSFQAGSQRTTQQIDTIHYQSLRYNHTVACCQLFAKGWRYPLHPGYV